MCSKRVISICNILEKNVIGIIYLFGIIILSIILNGAGIGAYIDIPTIIIVFGGTASILYTSFGLNVFSKIGKAILIAFKKNNFEGLEVTRIKIIDYAINIKRDGVLSIEENLNDNEKDTFIKKSLNLVIDSTKPEIIKKILKESNKHIIKRHNNTISILKRTKEALKYMGILGFFIGLIAFLANYNGSNSISMSITTMILSLFYSFTIIGLVHLIETILIKKDKEEIENNKLIIEMTYYISKEENIGNLKMLSGGVLHKSSD